jgi:hypothetical protein
VASVAVATLLLGAYLLGASRDWPYGPLHSFYKSHVARSAVASAGPTVSGDPQVLRGYRLTAGALALPDALSVLALRARLATFLFGGPPAAIDPAAVTTVRSVPPFALDGVTPARATLLTIRLGYGVTSKVYVLYPRRPDGTLVLYHQGHESPRSTDPAATFEQPQIAFLLRHRHVVAVLEMPLTGINNRPVARTPLGPVPLLTHDALALLDTDGRAGLRILLEPVAVTLNLLTRERSWRRIAMVGLSGGGWTTTVYAAVDPRIELSFPVAGSLPLPLRFQGLGDWEQYAPTLYRIADYPQLYALGASGRGREQLQILHLHDVCCFAGDFRALYVPAVQAALHHAGPGTFRSVVLPESAHTISPAALALIERELDA